MRARADGYPSGFGGPRPSAASPLFLPLLLLSIPLLLLLVADTSRAEAGREVLATDRSGWIRAIDPVTRRSDRLVRGEEPDLSPDGRFVAYVTREKDAPGVAPAELRVLDRRTGGSRRLLSAPRGLWSPSWSPDGRELAFLRGTEDVEREVWLIPAEGGSPRLLLSPGGDAGSSYVPPVWEDGETLWITDMSRLHRVRRTGERIDSRPVQAWIGAGASQDSTNRILPCPGRPDRVAFTRAVPGTPLFDRIFREPNTALFLREGNRVRRLSPPDWLVTDIRWSRDGRWIWFSGYRDREGREEYPFRICRIDPESGKILRLGRGEYPAP
jgi:hypothetical protein